MAGGARKILTGCLVVAGAFALGLVLLLVGYGAWGAHANTRAEESATALCAGIHAGEAIEPVVQKAAAGNPPAHLVHDGDDYHFYYFGMIYSSRECLVGTRGGRVTVKHVVVHDD